MGIYVSLAQTNPNFEQNGNKWPSIKLTCINFFNCPNPANETKFILIFPNLFN